MTTPRAAPLCAAVLAVAPSLVACQLVFPFDGLSGGAAPDAGDASRADGAPAADAGDAAPDAGLVLVLASGRTQPAEIAVDDAYAYWVEYAANGGVFRVKKDGSGAVEPVVTTQAFPVDVAVDARRVYWVTQGASGVGAVMSADKTGTDADVRTLASGQNFPNRVAIDASSIYWTLETDAPNGAVMWAPKDGSGAPKVLVGGLANPGGLAASPDGTAVFASVEGSVSVAGSKDGAILRIPRDVPCLDGTGCAATVAAGEPRPFVVRTDGAYVFWGQRWRDGDAPNAIRGAPRAGGDAGLVATSSVPTERVGLAVDGAGLAWTERADGGAVFLAPRDGGPPARLLADQPSPQGIAMDDRAVYVTTFGGGAIVRLARAP